jgi:hypothetical protein
VSAACFVIRKMFPVLNLVTLQTVYFAYIHLVIKHEIILWGNSTNVYKVFKLQKRLIRIMSGIEARSCRGLYEKLDILPVPCQYILSLTLFVIDNQNNF